MMRFLESTSAEVLTFALLVVLAAFLKALEPLLRRGFGSERAVSTPEEDSSFLRFQLTYLSVYFLATFCDWLQGPFLYEVYAHYGFSKTHIGLLFLVGSGSSGILGVFAGALADRWGRKKTCMAYCCCSIVACMLYNCKLFWCLLLGRLFSGLSTSILHSAFDSWLLCEHRSIRSYSNEKLSETYAKAAFGNGVVAVIAGFVASSAVRRYVSPLAPFNVAILFHVLNFSMLALLWTENYGTVATQSTRRSSGDTNRWSKPKEDEVRSSADDFLGIDIPTKSRGEKSDRQKQDDGHFGTSDMALERPFPNVCDSPARRLEIRSIISDRPEILWTGLTQAMFESGMYIFVLVWTPSLPRTVDKGHIFASFMVAVMIGAILSSLFTAIEVDDHFLIFSYLLLSSISMALSGASLFLSAPWTVTFCLFCLFEVGCGIHFTVFFSFRGRRILPEQDRATILALFRLPQVFMVLLVALSWSRVGLPAVMMACSGLHILGALFFWKVLGCPNLRCASREVSAAAKVEIP